MINVIKSVLNRSKIEDLRKEMSALESEISEIRELILRGEPSILFAGSLSERLKDDHTDLKSAGKQNRINRQDELKGRFTTLCLKIHNTMLQLKELGDNPKLNPGIRADIQQILLNKALSEWERINLT